MEGKDYSSLSTYLEDNWPKPLKRVFITFGNSRSIPSTYSAIEHAEDQWFDFLMIKFLKPTRERLPPNHSWMI